MRGRILISRQNIRKNFFQKAYGQLDNNSKDPNDEMLYLKEYEKKVIENNYKNIDQENDSNAIIIAKMKSQLFKLITNINMLQKYPISNFLLLLLIMINHSYIQQPTIHMNDIAVQKDDELIQNSLKNLPRFKKMEIVGEIFALLVLILCWAFFHQSFVYLNEKVPTEFDYNGNAVRYADKNILFALPAVMTISYIIFTILQFVPHRFNYDCVGLTVFNAQEIYRTTRITLLSCKLITEFLFTYITFTMLQVVQYECEPQRMYYAFVFILPYLIIGVFYYRKLKNISTQPQQL
ncbi:unnamed protein product [Paramecium pentaurelia]|uniref:Transmembrane protein n=1 Tax=Paramecium pentaurelia TaxID=43138 RepID=A0A8S1WYL6_9CILI|nr:unnamed protein product [Paramecium pentaurelia]